MTASDSTSDSTASTSALPTPTPPKDFAWRRPFALFGDVWVQFNPRNGRYRWRCPTRPEFADWSYAIFGSHNDAFQAAKDAFNRAPCLVGHTPSQPAKK